MASTQTAIDHGEPRCAGLTASHAHLASGNREPLPRARAISCPSSTPGAPGRCRLKPLAPAKGGRRSAVVGGACGLAGGWPALAVEGALEADRQGVHGWRGRRCPRGNVLCSCHQRARPWSTPRRISRDHVQGIGLLCRGERFGTRFAGQQTEQHSAALGRDLRMNRPRLGVAGRVGAASAMRRGAPARRQTTDPESEVGAARGGEVLECAPLPDLAQLAKCRSSRRRWSSSLAREVVVQDRRRRHRSAWRSHPSRPRRSRARRTARWRPARSPHGARAPSVRLLGGVLGRCFDNPTFSRYRLRPT